MWRQLNPLSHPPSAVAIVIALGVIPIFALVTASAQKRDQAIKIETDLVILDATVTDKDGAFIRDLKRDEFTVYDDGVPQTLDFFEANEKTSLTRPLAVVFAFDTSGSIKPEEVVRQREATENFIHLVQPESVFAVLTFNYEIRVIQDFTSDPRRISQAFARIGDASGSTRMFGAIDQAITMLKRAPRFRDGRRLRRVIVVVTDGIGSDSLDQDYLADRANDAGVTVYSITLPSYMPGLGTGQRAMTLLDASRIVPRTGGSDFSADAGDFAPIFKAIAEEIRSSYTLAYYPPPERRRDGKVHQIRIEVKKPGSIVRASRSSYTSPK
jgi:Ca-activated chloride channel homolog